MKKILLIVSVIGLSYLVQSCAPATIVSKMTAPVQSDRMAYEDDLISIAFTINTVTANFRMMNLSNRPIRIIWDNVSIVKNGEAQKAMHTGVKFIDSEKSQVPTLVPPQATVSESVMPSENAHYSSARYGGGWSYTPMFLPHESEAVLGVFLPIEHNGEIRDYYFTFDVSLGRARVNLKSKRVVGVDDTY